MKKILQLAILYISSIVFAQEPLSWYEFSNGNSIDLYGRNNLIQTGTTSTTTATNQPGRDGYSNESIELNSDTFSSNSLPIPRVSGTRSITLSLWFYVENDFSGQKTLVNSGITQSFTDFSNAANAVGTGYLFYIESTGTSSFRISTIFSDKPTASTINRYLNLGHTVTNGRNKWHNLVVRLTTKLDTGGWTMEMDRYVKSPSTAGQDNIASVTATTTDNTNIVYDSSTNNPTFSVGDVGNNTGLRIDDLVIYDKWLTNTETIAQNINKKALTKVANRTRITTSPNPTNLLFLNNTEVELTARDNTIEIFDGWTLGNLTFPSSSNPLTVIMSDHRSILANYIFSGGNRTIFVNHSATGSNDGSTWGNAFTDIKDAISDYNVGDEIWVAKGIYTSDSNVNSFITIAKENMKIYGGFNGTETTVNERDFILNETILSGDIAQPDVVQNSFVNYINAASRTDNSPRIINITGLGENLLLDGLTISDAHNISSNLGAAIEKSPAVEKLTIKNCIIKNNVCRGAGSGMLIPFEAPTGATNYEGELIIENCRFTNNWGAFATGAYIYNLDNTNANITISNSLFDNNYAVNGSTFVGGISSPAIWFRNLNGNTDSSKASTLLANIQNCTFANNIDDGSSSGSTISNKSIVSASKAQSANDLELNLKNSIFYGNKNYAGSLIKPTSQSIGSNPTSAVDIDNCFSEQSWGILAASSTNNIFGDPLFTDTINGDFTLKTGSTAIDSGDSAYATGATDLANNQRIFNTNVDMGAYEFGSSPTLSTENLNINNLALNIYPNPVQNKLHLNTKQTIDIIEIHTALGVKILTTNNKTIDVFNLVKGVYFITVKGTNGVLLTKKFIKK